MRGLLLALRALITLLIGLFVGLSMLPRAVADLLVGAQKFLTKMVNERAAR